VKQAVSSVHYNCLTTFMPVNICLTSADGQTGHLIAELLLTDNNFKSKVRSLTLVALDSSKCADLEKLGALVVPMDPADPDALLEALVNSGADRVMLIPPAKSNKMELVDIMLDVTRKAGIKNTVLLSSAGADLAERDKQPMLREFIDMEAKLMWNKGDTSTEAGHSPCIIRAGFYAENLLLYDKYIASTGNIPLPIGTMHKFAPIALGDVALCAALVLVGEGPHGLSDRHRGQLIVLTGTMLVAGEELATAANDALNLKLKFEDISPETAKEVLDRDTDLDESEKEYLLEYYSLVREGKTNYVSTIAFASLTGKDPDLPMDFFKTYSLEFKPKRRKTTK